jgi:hypothetical protein
MEFREYRIAAKNVKSLQWHSGSLFDWVAGGQRYELDGSKKERHIGYAYRFDTAIMSPSGEYAVLYERLGTKGLLLREGTIVRELNRSFYQAHAYEYPITFVRLSTGHEGLVHCPDHYNVLEVEDALSGKRLTSNPQRKPVDIFFSRLAPSPAHRFLLMAGWVWHPWDVVGVYDVEQALANPSLLDGFGVAPRTAAELGAAAFSDERTLVLVTSDEPTDDDDDADDEGADNSDPIGKSGSRTIAYYDLQTQTYGSIVRAQETIGKIMPVGARYLVGFYDHPKLFDRLTGAIVQRWPALATGREISSIQWHQVPLPPLALDSKNKRFAVADQEGITVIELQIDE